MRSLYSSADCNQQFYRLFLSWVYILARDDRDGTGQWEWKIRNKNAAISRLETGTTSPQGTASTQPYGFVAKASRFQPSGGTPKNVKNWTTFVPLGVPSLSSLILANIISYLETSAEHTFALVFTKY